MPLLMSFGYFVSPLLHLMPLLWPTIGYRCVIGLLYPRLKHRYRYGVKAAPWFKSLSIFVHPAPQEASSPSTTLIALIGTIGPAAATVAVSMGASARNELTRTAIRQSRKLDRRPEDIRWTLLELSTRMTISLTRDRPVPSVLVLRCVQAKLNRT
jgi:hypothetical protein